MKVLKNSAELLAESWLFRGGKQLWSQNQKDWELPLTRKGKLLTGLYIILKDYAVGRFPPTFPDQQKAYEAEIEFEYRLPGITGEQVKDANLRKPFWYGKLSSLYLRNFTEIANSLRRLGIAPPAKLLELGCGSGWTAEFLSLMKYEVIGTTISPHEVEDGQRRIESIRTKNLKPSLRFIAAPMESVHAAIRDESAFDAVYVYEALHH